LSFIFNSGSSAYFCCTFSTQSAVVQAHTSSAKAATPFLLQAVRLKTMRT